jgi:hypothetical protein
MGNLPVLLSNVTPLVNTFFEMSKKRQSCAIVNLENNFSISAKFTVIESNNYSRISRITNKTTVYSKYLAIENKKNRDGHDYYYTSVGRTYKFNSNVINYNSNCRSGLSRHLLTTYLDYFVFN